MTRFCSKIGWKWKWSEKCLKSEISLIWCISTTNNVKSCKKFDETAQTANFTDFSLTSCEYRPKWTKPTQTQTRRVRLQNFLRGIQVCHMKADVLPFLKMWFTIVQYSDSVWVTWFIWFFREVNPGPWVYIQKAWMEEWKYRAAWSHS